MEWRYASDRIDTGVEDDALTEMHHTSRTQGPTGLHSSLHRWRVVNALRYYGTVTKRRVVERKGLKSGSACCEGVDIHREQLLK